jgi:hypothetical protein
MLGRRGHELILAFHADVRNRGTKRRDGTIAMSSLAPIPQYAGAPGNHRDWELAQRLKQGFYVGINFQPLN